MDVSISSLNKVSKSIKLKLVVVARTVRLSVAVLVRLQLLAWFEPNRLARRNRHFFSRARIPPDASLPRLHHKDAKAAQLDSFTARQSFLHRVKERLDGLFGFHFWHAGFIGHAIDDV